MLIDEINKSIENGERYILGKNAAIDISDFNLVSADFSEMSKRLYPMLEHEEDLYEAGLKCELNKSTLIDYFTFLKENVSERDFQHAKHNISAINTEVTNCDNTLISFWKEYCTKKMDVNRRLIGVFSHVIESSDAMNDLLLLEQKILSVVVGNKQIVAAIDAFNQGSEKLLRSMEVGPKVKEFITKISQGETVSIADLNDDVIKWIVSSGAEDKFIISVENS